MFILATEGLLFIIKGYSWYIKSGIYFSSTILSFIETVVVGPGVTHHLPIMLWFLFRNSRCKEWHASIAQHSF